MAHSRRAFLLGSLPALAAAAGCGRPVDQGDRKHSFDGRLSRARNRAADFLTSQQSKDGAWRSDVYGLFKDGTALTPLALHALLTTTPDRKASIRKAADYLAAMVKPDGKIVEPSYGFEFALYTAALSVTALSHPNCPQHSGARAAWLKMLRQRQLTEELGWKPEDREYGGWGYFRDLPRKPKPGELRHSLLESNLSATTFALEALRATGVPDKDPCWAKALVFVKRCQNWTDDACLREPAFDDGGFFFIYDDPVRNKAGVAGTDRSRRVRYHSYGSTTADGLRCLAYCGVAETAPRRQAARAWLVQHFSGAEHPGTYEAMREAARMAVYHYYAASLVKGPCASLPVTTKDGIVPLKQVLAEAVMKRQGTDGSWVNPVETVRENDPIACTSFALLALA